MQASIYLTCSIFVLQWHNILIDVEDEVAVEVSNMNGYQVEDNDEVDDDEQIQVPRDENATRPVLLNEIHSSTLAFENLALDFLSSKRIGVGSRVVCKISCETLQNGQHSLMSLL